MFPWNFSPFNKDALNSMKRLKPEEVENYVQEMMGKMFPPEMQGTDFMKGFQQMNENSTKSHKEEISIFESHDDVYVRIPIQNRQWLKEINIFHTSNQLIIEHFPKEKDKKTITLPALVKKKGARAHYKDGTLEIRIPKSVDFQYSEIDIKETY